MQNDIIVSLVNIITAILTIVYCILIKKTKTFIGKEVKTRKIISYILVVLYITRVVISFIINESIIFTIWYILVTLIWIMIFSKDIFLSKVYDFMKRTGILEEYLDKDLDKGIEENKSK